MKSLKPRSVAVEDYKQHHFKEAEANTVDNFRQSTIVPNMPQRILSANVLKLQRMIGNQAVQRLLLSRMANTTKVQRAPKTITGTDERIEEGSNNDGILTITLNDAQAINGEITDIAVINGSDKINIKAKHAHIENDGDSVTITVNLNKTEISGDVNKITFVSFRVESSGSSGDAGQRQGDDTGNSGASLEFPPVKTQEDFISEEEYRAYLIEEILARGAKKEEGGIWKTQPYNFKAKLLQPLSTSDLVDLLTITTERSNYKAAQCFVSNPSEECLQENPD